MYVPMLAILDVVLRYHWFHLSDFNQLAHPVDEEGVLHFSWCWCRGQITEKAFFELLQLNSIRVLYDFRASDHRGKSEHSIDHMLRAHGWEWKTTSSVVR